MITILTFGFKHGQPTCCDFPIDCRDLRNPHRDLMLRPLNGKDIRVQDYVKADPDFDRLMDHARGAAMSGPQTLAIGCTGGRHRSVAVAELLAAELRAKGFPVEITHRDL